MPLTMINAGEDKTIKKIGGNDRHRQFLESLGFVEGARVSVVSQLGGNIIVNIKDSRVAIDKNMANRILV